MTRERVAVVGSRTFPDLDRVRAFVRSLPSSAVVVSGGAAGVDAAAEDEARTCGLAIQVYRPDWQRYGKRAGAVRNQKIVDVADRVVAFTTGTRGTAITIDLALRAGKPLEVYDAAGELIEAQP